MKRQYKINKTKGHTRNKKVSQEGRERQRAKKESENGKSEPSNLIIRLEKEHEEDMNKFDDKASVKMNDGLIYSGHLNQIRSKIAIYDVCDRDSDDEMFMGIYRIDGDDIIQDYPMSKTSAVVGTVLWNYSSCE